MLSGFTYPEIRVNPEYMFDQLMQNYQNNFEIIESGSTGGSSIFTGGTINGDVNVIGDLELSGDSIHDIFAKIFNIIDGGSW